jgi:hypothetical protein
MTTQNTIDSLEQNAVTDIDLSSDIQKIVAQVEKLTEIGIALSSEKDTVQLLEKSC